VEAPRSRWLWLDAFRGLAVVGMTFVNACIYLHEVLGAEAPPFLLHSPWLGFTVADAVFPAFIIAVGLSAAVSLPSKPAEPGPVIRKILLRAMRLFLLGLLISNLGLIEREPGATFRVMGVLQRIAIVYAAVGVSLVHGSTRSRVMAAAALLAGYWGVLLLRPPDGALDLTRPALDVPAWFDRHALPGLLYVNGPQGFDPEGLLSTLPAIAQGLLGALLCKPLAQAAAGRGLWRAGGLALAAGAASLALSGVMPISKSLWTPTFVVLSTAVATGVAILLIVAEQRNWLRAVSAVLASLGRNAIVAYALQEVCGDVLRWAPLRWGAPLGLGPLTVALADASAFTLLMAIPVLVMARSGRAIRI
jgi:predicted acyltransferase